MRRERRELMCRALLKSHVACLPAHACMLCASLQSNAALACSHSAPSLPPQAQSSLGLPPRRRSLKAAATDPQQPNSSVPSF